VLDVADRLHEQNARPQHRQSPETDNSGAQSGRPPALQAPGAGRGLVNRVW
jgi:hypothetical protein